MQKEGKEMKPIINKRTVILLIIAVTVALWAFWVTRPSAADRIRLEDTLEALSPENQALVHQSEEWQRQARGANTEEDLLRLTESVRAALDRSDAELAKARYNDLKRRRVR